MVSAAKVNNYKPGENMSDNKVSNQDGLIDSAPDNDRQEEGKCIDCGGDLAEIGSGLFIDNQCQECWEAGCSASWWEMMAGLEEAGEL
jgi:hypothetical protein